MHLDQTAERLESLKAGVLAVVATAIGIFCIGAVHQFFLAQFFLAQGFSAPQRAEISWTIGFNLASLLQIASILMSGFLLGVTYRYIVRQDNNLQLKAGAVMAFGLVRGLAQAEVRVSQMPWATMNFADIFTHPEIWQVGVGIVESIILFALAAVVLDRAIDRGWIKAFTTF